MLHSKAQSLTSAKCKPCRAHRAPKPIWRTSKAASGSADTPHPASRIWMRFEDRVEGNWEGAFASFNPQDGLPIPFAPYQDPFVPYRYPFVPYQDPQGGEKRYDWQTTCSSLAETVTQGSDAGIHLSNQCSTTIRPPRGQPGTYGYALQSYVETQCLDEGLLAVAPDGSYVAGPLQLDVENERARVEFCLPLAPAALPQQQQMERVRVVTRLQVNWRNFLRKRWDLGRVDVYRERERGRQEGMPGFSKSKPLSEEQAKNAEALPITSGWAYDKDPRGGFRLSKLCNASLEELQIAQHPDMMLTLLPLGLALQSSMDEDKGEVFLQLLMVVGDRQMRVALCSYAGCQMQRAVMGSHKG
ncbi:hypothetical protein DUNSADRAFT_1845 [Dunaliella salina]|uniref:Uncharacterized protein n=1 Tax=Dunaliella salina TaxID=3046 RepID=A0ABQ7GWJ3_DUNSA|nr:hypothetical protein DUNSADRAFT_1845 [Dunaliella salina]|eukprot:KAF5838978.1 hypothetical protein DUNSADRAFT_1845 [Dunaliella salina]